MRQQGGHFCPLHLGAWHQMAFKVVGVNFDKTGHQIITLHIPTTGMNSVALVHRLDFSVLDANASIYHFVS